jgi:DNA-binding NtrC family response regulator
MLESYPWPGNVRELGNTIQKALIFNRGAPVSQEDILPAIKAMKRQDGPHGCEEDQAILDWVRKALTAENRDNIFESCLDRFSSILIAEALRLCGGNRSRAARMLGLSRPTLHAKIEKYSIRCETSIIKE